MIDPTQYVEVAGADVPYQIVGRRECDPLYRFGLGAASDFWWEDKRLADSFRR